MHHKRSLQSLESTLKNLKTKEIPRWCKYASSSDTIESHVFSDLSSIA